MCRRKLRRAMWRLQLAPDQAAASLERARAAVQRAFRQPRVAQWWRYLAPAEGEPDAQGNGFRDRAPDGALDGEKEARRPTQLERAEFEPGDGGLG